MFRLSICWEIHSTPVCIPLNPLFSRHKGIGVQFTDEPTGNLDSASSKEILQILKDLHSGGRTVILITHDDKIAEQAYRIIRILDGKIESDRKNDKILESREEIK